MTAVPEAPHQHPSRSAGAHPSLLAPCAFTLSAGELRRQLERAERFSKPGSLADYERFVFLESTGSVLRLRVHQVEGDLVLPLAVNGPLPAFGPLAIEGARPLVEWVKTFAAQEPVRISVEGGPHRLTLVGPGSRKVRYGSATGAIPLMDGPDAREGLVLDAADLARALRVAAWVQDPPTGTRPWTESVVLDVADDGLESYGPGWSHLVRRRVPLVQGGWRGGSLLVPPRPLEALRKGILGDGVAGTVLIEIQERRAIRFAHPAFTLTVRLTFAEGRHGFAAILRLPALSTVCVPAADLLLAIRRAREETTHRAMTIEGREGELRLSCASDGARGEAVVPAAVAVPFRQLVNGQTLHELVAELAGAGEMVRLSVTAAPPGSTAQAAIHLGIDGASDREAMLGTMVVG